MTEDVESYSQAEIVRLLKGVSADVRDLRGEVHALGSTFVTRAELTAWQTAYDREIRDLKDSTKPVRVSGWVIVSAAVGVVALAVSVLVAALNLINALK